MAVLPLVYGEECGGVAEDVGLKLMMAAPENEKPTVMQGRRKV